MKISKRLQRATYSRLTARHYDIIKTRSSFNLYHDLRKFKTRSTEIYNTIIGLIIIYSNTKRSLQFYDMIFMSELYYAVL